MPSVDDPRRLHLLLYDYVDDVLTARVPHRGPHLEHAGRWREEGRLLMGGAMGDPPHTGVLVFEVGDAADVEAFAAADPYVVNGVVTSWRVEPWTVVI